MREQPQDLSGGNRLRFFLAEFNLMCTVKINNYSGVKMLPTKENQRIVDRLFRAIGTDRFGSLLENISASADLNIPCSITADTLLKYALDREYFEEAKLLIAAGADPNFCLDGISPIEQARLFKQDWFVDIMQASRRHYEASVDNPAV